MMLQRMIRALKLDASVFEEVEHDRTATGQALGVVLIASVLASIWTLFGEGGLSGLLGALVGAVFGWLIWSVVTWLVGTTLFGGRADLGEMLRALGFAYTPVALGIVPILGTLVGFVLTVVTFVLAVRQALDFTTGKAIGTVLIGFVVVLVFWVVVGVFFGMLGAVAGA